MPRSSSKSKQTVPQIDNLHTSPTVPVEVEVMTLGRPTIFSDELADSICELLAEGYSLRMITRQPGMPAIRTIYNWMRAHESFLQQYTRAKQDAADSMADDIQEIGDRVLTGQLDPHAARVAIDAKKWIAAKLKPKVYGDKLDLTSGGNELPRPILTLPIAPVNTTNDQNKPQPRKQVSQNAGEIPSGNIMDDIKPAE